MTARCRSLALVLFVMCLASSARADQQADTRSRDRTVFYAALAATAVGVATCVFARTRVGAAEDDLDQLGPMVAQEQGFDGSEFVDVCAEADGDDGAASAEAVSVCRRGKRWSTITTVSAGVAIGSAVVAGVFALRMVRATDAEAGQKSRVPAPRAAWRAQPFAGPTAVGLGLDLEF